MFQLITTIVKTGQPFKVTTEYFPKKEDAVKAMITGMINLTGFKSLEEILERQKTNSDIKFTESESWGCIPGTSSSLYSGLVQWNIMEIPGMLPSEVKAELDKKMEDNAENLESDDSGYGKGYAEGYHDFGVEMYHLFGIKTNEDYLN